MTTNQTERVSDEELDQMIWKLERDGMTPKMLSLMRELREVRRYRVQRAPVVGVIDETLIEGLRFVQCMLDDYRESNYGHAMDWVRHINTKMEEYSGKHGDDAYRVMRETMRYFGNSEQLEPVSNRDELPPNSFTNEELAGMSHGDNPQANAYRELLARRLNSPATPDGWIPVSERMPDPKSELRVCVYTPNPHEDIRYRFVPASLFKAVCRDATHWHYMSAPKEVG